MEMVVGFFLVLFMVLLGAWATEGDILACETPLLLMGVVALTAFVGETLSSLDFAAKRFGAVSAAIEDMRKRRQI